MMDIESKGDWVMTREILFRGKDDVTGDWVYGYLASPKWYLNEKSVTIIIPKDMTLYPRCEISSYYFVNKETVGQWTGLVDKNGTKIFEGDVVDNPCWIVTYAGDKNEHYQMPCGWYIQRDDFESWTELVCGAEYRVIGNIHDNPELLEKDLEKRFMMWTERGKKIAIPDSNGETLADRLAKIDISKELKLLGFEE